MKEPLKFTVTLTDGAGVVKSTNVLDNLTQADAVSIQEAVSAALVTLGKSKIK